MLPGHPVFQAFTIFKITFAGRQSMTFKRNTFLTSSENKQPIHISRYEQPNEKNAFGLFAFPRFDSSGKPYFTGKEKSITLRSDLKIPIAQRGGRESYSIFVKMEPKKMLLREEFCL